MDKESGHADHRPLTSRLSGPIDGAFPAGGILAVILARGFAERHFGRGFVLPLRQHIATVDLDRLAEFIGFLTRLRKRKQLGAAQADILALAVALQPKKPRGPFTLIDLQKQPVAVLIGARMHHSRLDRQSRELFHMVNPIFSHTRKPDS